ncbi:MAG: hypothetical protein ONB30_09860 [candidate division KSB1 bacterium]|nr:hypothetical protein [candidate division KSB1 bacterium]
MRDQVWVHVDPTLVTIQYESLYLGQIAPHTRCMIDTDADSLLTEQEVAAFFTTFGAALNKLLGEEPLSIDGRNFWVRLVECDAPGLLQDSLLAPLRLRMVFVVDSCALAAGVHEITADPRLFFLGGNLLIDMAKERVALTEAQERAIGRLLQIRVVGSPAITFVSTYPGYIKRELGTVLISGVFYDQTVLRIRKGKYATLRVRFTCQPQTP